MYCDLLSTKGTNAHLRFSLENTSAPPKHYSYTDTIKDKIITKTVKTQRQANKLNNIARLLKAQIYISIYSLLEEQKKIFGTEYNTYKNEYDDLYSCVSDKVLVVKKKGCSCGSHGGADAMGGMGGMM